MESKNISQQSNKKADHANIDEVPDFVIESMARVLLPKIQAYFESPEGRAEFEKWQTEHSKV